ncbi:hypothetical protein [Clavibacter michiganensis]|uniref:hypothetical protein n=1 Tax=Clavibacter michiganensis TaxID=28447 RepID=UPI003DA02237
MIIPARRRPSPLLALTLALVVGVSLAGAAPAQAAPSGASLPLTSVAAPSLPAPEVFVGGEVTDVPEIEVILSVDVGSLDVRSPRFEYLLDGAGSWRTAYSGPLDHAYIRIAAPAGPHTIAFRAAGALDGVPVIGAASAPVAVLSLGYPTRYDPVITVDGPRITLAWDVRGYLAGWPEERSVVYAFGDDPYTFADAVGSTTLDVGYDRTVRLVFWHGPNVDVARYVYLELATGSPPGTPSFASAPTPTVVGRAVPGSTLSVRTGTWRPGPVTLAYQWYRDGQRISDASGPTYEVDARFDGGKRITVGVRGSAPGRASVERVSAPTPRVTMPVISPGVPAIGGLPLVGRQLTVRTGFWRPAPITLTYRWLRDGVVIPGAEEPAYTPVAADRGRLLEVSVTGERYPYPTVSRTSVAVRVG